MTRAERVEKAARAMLVEFDWLVNIGRIHGYEQTRDALRAALALPVDAPVDAGGAFRDIWQHDETGRIVELPLGSPSPGHRYALVATTNTPAPASEASRPLCKCGCQDKLHDAGPFNARRCNQPGCACEDFTAPASEGRPTLAQPAPRGEAVEPALGEKQRAVESFRYGWARCIAANVDRFMHGAKALLPTESDESEAVRRASLPAAERGEAPRG